MSDGFQCFTCARFLPNNAERTTRGLPLACAAFPDGIPTAIIVGDHDHTTPHTADGGLMWVLSDVAAAEQEFATAQLEAAEAAE